MAIRLETCKRRGIDNHQDSEISTFHRNWAKDLPKHFRRATPRTNYSPVYNCHGLVFASRRTRIEKSTSIQRILDDDKYFEIPMKDVLPGDIVIYYSEKGDPNHSGIVVEYGPPRVLVPVVCSKWGNAGEFVHALADCPRMYGPLHKFFRCTL